jgi:cyclic pyranopterin phosphate synthase
MPDSGINLLKHEDILSFEEIVAFAKIAVGKGIDKVRITGGEPLVRKGVIGLTAMLSQIKGIKELTLTTNGILLEEFAKPLADAGLHRVNVSLDVVDPDRYSELTRGGDVKKVINGIAAAQKAGLTPVKINCVINETSEEPDAIGVKTFCESQGLEVRFIQLMNLETGKFAIIEGSNGGNCSVCNKLRLSSDGMLRPCLFNDIAFNICKLGADKAIEMSLAAKPKSGTVSFQNKFNEIGG